MLKQLIRQCLLFFHLDLSKNLKYDRLTKKILKRELRSDYNCLDIGCHKGEILDLLLKYAPDGKHYGFEPLPNYNNKLMQKYSSRATISSVALSDTNGETNFHYVKNAPAYSGIRKRKYDIDNPEIEEIIVKTRTLDAFLPGNYVVDFIKIDVEGGEFAVLKGGLETLIKNKPTILFECGKGASDYYGTKPKDIYEFITLKIGLNIYALQDFVDNKLPMTAIDFINCFESNKEYYFIAKQPF